MLGQVFFNLFLAFIWMGLMGTFDAPMFVSGYVLGSIIMYVLYHKKQSNFYLGRLYKLAALLLVFAWELIKANATVIKRVWSPKVKLTPGIIAMDVDFKYDWELVVLMNMITLTPGTTSIEISADNRTLYVHALDASDPDAVIEDINNTFTRRIKEVSGYGK